MKYVGSKRRLAKHILTHFERIRKQHVWYVEPFVGGGNIIDKVSGKRIGCDLDPYVVCLLEAVSQGWEPPENVSEDTYYAAKSSLEITPFIAFVGYCCSFGGKWFGGYARGNKSTGEPRNYAAEAKRNLEKQAVNLVGVKFECNDYRNLSIPEKSLIYCDPPYKGTTGYSCGVFDSESFWDWCRVKYSEGHSVLVSEYTAPEDFCNIMEVPIHSSLTKNTGSKQGVEKLFVFSSEIKGEGT